MNPFFSSIFLLLLALSAISCNSYKLSVERVSTLTPTLREVSGLVMNEQQQLWGLNDSGNPASLYQVDLDGQLLDSMTIEGANNIDWEALTIDPSGKLYILDGGNNSHSRKDLKMYIWDKDSRRTEIIPFAYQNQLKFPPKEEEKFFDLEAAFWDNGYVYLIGKNKFMAAEAGANMYRLPTKAGSYGLNPMTRLDFDKFVATDAALSPSGRLAILTYKKASFPSVPGLKTKLFIIEKWNADGPYEATGSVRVPRKGLLRQYEAIEWLSEDKLVIGSEEILGKKPVLVLAKLKKRK